MWVFFNSPQVSWRFWALPCSQPQSTGPQTTAAWKRGGSLRSASQFHPNGFVGELPLVDAMAAAGQEAFLQAPKPAVGGQKSAVVGLFEMQS